jgi:hypothetical protein
MAVIAGLRSSAARSSHAARKSAVCPKVRLPVISALRGTK